MPPPAKNNMLYHVIDLQQATLGVELISVLQCPIRVLAHSLIQLTLAFAGCLVCTV